MRFLLFLLLPFVSFAFLENSGAGDYIVLEKNKVFTALVIKEISNEKIVVDEVSIIKPRNCWKEWIKSDYLQNNGWVRSTIDLKEKEFKSSFSISQNRQLTLPNNHILTQLLTSKFITLPESLQKKIGLPPEAGEIDTRSLWRPEIIYNGQKTIPNKVLQTTLQNESETQTLDLYFINNFSLPVSINLVSNHYQLILHVIECGNINQ